MNSSVAIVTTGFETGQNTMDETGMDGGMRLEDKGSRIDGTESLGAGLQIQLGSRKDRGRRGQMGDAKKWELNREAEFEGEEGQSGKCERERGAHNTGRRERSASVHLSSTHCTLRCVQASPPCARRTACDFWRPGCRPEETEGMRKHGPIKALLCTAKAWGEKGKKEAEGGRADLRRATSPSPWASDLSSERRTSESEREKRRTAPAAGDPLARRPTLESAWVLHCCSQGGCKCGLRQAAQNGAGMRRMAVGQGGFEIHLGLVVEGSTESGWHASRRRVSSDSRPGKAEHPAQQNNDCAGEKRRSQVGRQQ